MKACVEIQTKDEIVESTAESSPSSW